MTTSRQAAHIEWITIPAPDLRAAEMFYREVFGFSISTYSDSFLVFKAGNLSGALDQDLAPSAEGVGFSLTVQDIDETLQLVTEFGGGTVKDKYELAPDTVPSSRIPTVTCWSYTRMPSRTCPGYLLCNTGVVRTRERVLLE